MEPKICTLRDCLSALAQKQPQKKLLGDSTEWLAARQLLEVTGSIGAMLLEAGIHSGDYVALRAERSVDTCLVILGLQAIGAVAVLTEPHDEVDAFLESYCAEIPVRAAIFRQNGDKALTCQNRETGAVHPFVPREVGCRPLPDCHVDPQAGAFVIFTSGSTGKSRAVVLSQSNFVNNLLDSQPLGYYCDDDIALGALPLNHVFGLVLLSGIAVLGYALFLPEGKDIHAILAAIEQEKITRMNGVPSLYLAMAAQQDGFDLSSLRAGFIGGGPCTLEQFHSIEARLGITLISVYGMSECIGISCSSYKDTPEMRAGGVGRIYPMNTVKILLENGVTATDGQEGEICVNGPARMLGYFGEALGADDFIHTGDLGYLDALGVLHLSGRKKDIIISNGNNLFPLHIENALLSIPGVSAAAVVGLPDEARGEAPWTMVQCTTQAEKQLPAALDKLLAKNERPMGILRVEALPMTASGKTDKQKVREVLRQWTTV